MYLQAHGGYLCRLEALDARVLRAAREAVDVEGEELRGVSLRISVIPRRKVVRLAYETPNLRGEQGARWYEAHHALPRLLSRELKVTVHSYVFVPDAFEQVAAYGAGRHVGGERLAFDEVDFPGGGESLDEAAFERLKSRWPLGHLAYIFGVTREALLRLPWEPSLRLRLDGSDASEQLSSALPVSMGVA